MSVPHLFSGSLLKVRKPLPRQSAEPWQRLTANVLASGSSTDDVAQPYKLKFRRGAARVWMDGWVGGWVAFKTCARARKKKRLADGK